MWNQGLHHMHSFFENYSKLNCKKITKNNVLYINKVLSQGLKTRKNTPEKENKLEYFSELKHLHTKASK